MHTLIIAENEAQIGGMLRDPGTRITLPQGVDPLRYVLHVWDGGSPEATLAAGPDSALGAVAVASADRTKRRILEFAEHCLDSDRLNDEVRVQLIFLFHRSHRKVVRTLVKAIRMLDADHRWRKLPDTYLRALNTRRVVLLSCESGIEMNAQDRRYSSFVRQSHDLRVSSAVTFRLEQKPPPSRPPQYWDPFIYTFSTGDFLTGGTRLHPNRVSFVRCPNNQLQGQGDAAHMGSIPGTDGNAEEPAAGTIHKYQGANYVGSLDVPAGTEYDIVQDSF
jgi:hypothetical protein